MSRHAYALILVFLLALTSRVSGDEKSLKKVTFMPLWSPQAQFAGFYYARDKGLYREKGLDVTIMQSGPSTSPARCLAENKTQFALLQLSTAMVLRDRGVPIVNIGQLHQHSGLMFVAIKTSSIQTLQDLEGKRVGLWPPDARYEADMLLRKKKLHVEIIPQSYTINLFLCGGVDVASATLYNEYHCLLDSGYNEDSLVTFPFRDHGMDYPQDGIYVREELLRRDPGLCRAFVRASQEGWKQAYAHPEETLEMVLTDMRNVHLPASKAHQRWMLNKLRDLMGFQAGTGLPGTLEEEQFNNLGNALKEYGYIKKIPVYRELFTFCGEHDKE